MFNLVHENCTATDESGLKKGFPNVLSRLAPLLDALMKIYVMMEMDILMSGPL
jgi:hypothetical protein